VSADTPAALATASAINPASAPVPQLAGEEPLDEIGLLFGGAGKQVAEEVPASRRRSASGRSLDFGDRAVEVVDGKRRLTGVLPLDAVDRRVAHSNPSLPGYTGQQANGDRDLARIELSQQLGEDRNLARSRARVGDVLRGAGDFGEERQVEQESLATCGTLLRLS